MFPVWFFSDFCFSLISQNLWIYSSTQEYSIEQKLIPYFVATKLNKFKQPRVISTAFSTRKWYFNDKREIGHTWCFNKRNKSKLIMVHVPSLPHHFSIKKKSNLSIINELSLVTILMSFYLYLFQRIFLAYIWSLFSPLKQSKSWTQTLKKKKKIWKY